MGDGVFLSPTTFGEFYMTEIGDPVEYKIICHSMGEGPWEEWRPATVIQIDSFQICIQDSNNIRRAIPLYSSDWRRI